jgi:hypothetical protein
MKSNTLNSLKHLTGGALVMAAVSAAYGDGTNAAPAAAAPAIAAPAEKPGFLTGTIPEAFTHGTFNINVRTRYEYVDQSNLTQDSNAGTIRTRFGFTTAPVYGFQAMIEAQNTTPFDYDSYNAANSNGQNGRPVVADPKVTDIDQAWLGYSYTNQFKAFAGRQRIVLDNARFVGDVGWRQNMQTFDSLFGSYTPFKDFTLSYGYLWGVNRVFGDVSGLPAALTDFDSNSHLVNASLGTKYGKLVGYTYLLDLHNAAPTDLNSCATYGLSFAGSAPVSEKVKLNYRAELAFQTDYADSPLNYETEYYTVEVGAAIKPVTFGLGYEVLGSDNNVGFKTPLATLHAFNGWADVFLNTPALGLRDLYGYAQVTLPAEVPLRAIYHKFDSDAGSADFGSEIDLVASRKFGKNWTALLKYAYYMGEDLGTGLPAGTDVQKFWAQVEFNF